MTVPPYSEICSAPGTWTCAMRLPAAPLAQVREQLTELALATGWPVAAFLYGADGDLVTELLLYRDPSLTYGTPSPAECDDAARSLTKATGWTSRPGENPAGGVLVGLGLREGYDAGAPEHDPAEVSDRLAECDMRMATLVSARQIGDTVRWYDEPGVVIHGPAPLLPDITELADRFAQDRFVVTDLGAHRTYALALAFPPRGRS